MARSYIGATPVTRSTRIRLKWVLAGTCFPPWSDLLRLKCFLGAREKNLASFYFREKPKQTSSTGVGEWNGKGMLHTLASFFCRKADPVPTWILYQLKWEVAVYLPSSTTTVNTFTNLFLSCGGITCTLMLEVKKKRRFMVAHVFHNGMPVIDLNNEYFYGWFLKFGQRGREWLYHSGYNQLPGVIAFFDCLVMQEKSMLRQESAEFWRVGDFMSACAFQNQECSPLRSMRGYFEGMVTLQAIINP